MYGRVFFAIFVKKDMKKLLYIIGFITLLGCSESEGILTPIEDNSNCYNIIRKATGSPECVGTITITVMASGDFDKIDSAIYPAESTIICVTNTDYTFNDFSLGQLICDLSVYK